MNKFIKKIKKSLKSNHSVLILGNSFGHTKDLINYFQTVFIISTDLSKFKHKNVVYRENLVNINDIGPVTAIFIDIDQLNYLEQMPTYLTRFNPIILIQGNEPIDRSKSIQLYHYGYRCLEQLSFCHLWKRK